jgi:hypothetical protein
VWRRCGGGGVAAAYVAAARWIANLPRVTPEIYF